MPSVTPSLPPSMLPRKGHQKDLGPVAREAEKGATEAIIKDALGRKRDDGTSFFDVEPLAANSKYAAEGVFDGHEIKRFVERYKAAQGPLTTLAPEDIPDDMFEGVKAAALIKYGRDPSEVTEGYFRAAGTVAGEQVAPRDIFWQRWKPIGTPNGNVVLIAPGFEETGRDFYEQVNLLNKAGYDVVLMDEQWAGYSDGAPGGIDRGFGVARDVAAAAAFAQNLLDTTYGTGPKNQLVIAGHSMGGGPGVLGSVTLNDAGLIALDGGVQMPKGARVKVFAEAPFFEATDNARTRAAEVLAKIPGFNALEQPDPGLIKTTTSRQDAAVGSLGLAENAVKVQGRSLDASIPDNTQIMGMIRDGKAPQEDVYIAHARGDLLANFETSQQIVQAMNDQKAGRAQLVPLDSDNHLIPQDAAQRGLIVTGADWLTGR